jgi:hypothetical protein
LFNPSSSCPPFFLCFSAILLSNVFTYQSRDFMSIRSNNNCSVGLVGCGHGLPYGPVNIDILLMSKRDSNGLSVFETSFSGLWATSVDLSRNFKGSMSIACKILYFESYFPDPDTDF